MLEPKTPETTAPSWQRRALPEPESGSGLEVGDISMVVAVRLHDGNPWVLERLDLLGGHYQPRPEVIVVDFGSRDAHRDRVEACAERHGLSYLHVPDYGTFSLARARNLGVLQASGSLVFFSDVDCIGERNLFERMVSVAAAAGMAQYVDRMLNLPVYHLDEATSARVLAAAEPERRSQRVLASLVAGVYAEAGVGLEYVDPSSNFFLCHRSFYNLIGGYNEEFRGHGSEDFEFMLRFALHAQETPLPEAPLRNVYRPRRDVGRGPRKYRGFRRLGELLALPAETSGLRIAHLYHPRGDSLDSWYAEGDSDKSKLREQARPYLERAAALCGYDWMPRSGEAVALLTGPDDWALLMPLRLLGFRLHAVSCGGEGPRPELRGLLQSLPGDTVLAMVEANVGDAVACAREHGVPVIALQPTEEPGRFRYRRFAPGEPLQPTASQQPLDPDVWHSTDALFDVPAAWDSALRSPVCVKLPGMAGKGALLPRAALEGGDIYRSYAAGKLGMKHGTSPLETAEADGSSSTRAPATTVDETAAASEPGQAKHPVRFGILPVFARWWSKRMRGVKGRG